MHTEINWSEWNGTLQGYWWLLDESHRKQVELESSKEEIEAMYRDYGGGD